MAKTKKVRTEDFTQNMKCILTDEEVKAASQKMAQIIQESNQLEKDKKSCMAGFKAKLDAANALLVDCSNKVRDGYEYRDVSCKREYDFGDATIRLTRLDTKEVFEERSMEQPEKDKETLFDQKKK